MSTSSQILVQDANDIALTDEVRSIVTARWLSELLTRQLIAKVEMGEVISDRIPKTFQRQMKTVGRSNSKVYVIQKRE